MFFLPIARIFILRWGFGIIKPKNVVMQNQLTAVSSYRTVLLKSDAQQQQIALDMRWKAKNKHGFGGQQTNGYQKFLFDDDRRRASQLLVHVLLTDQVSFHVLPFRPLSCSSFSLIPNLLLKNYMWSLSPSACDIFIAASLTSAPSVHFITASLLTHCADLRHRYKPAIKCQAVFILPAIPKKGKLAKSSQGQTYPYLPLPLSAPWWNIQLGTVVDIF